MSKIIYRKAKIDDVSDIQALINYYANKGLMLAKPLVALYENLRDYTVAEKDEKIIGVGGLHIMWGDLAEIRSLAVAEDYKGMGIGKKLVEIFTVEAIELGVPDLFALTYQANFFIKLGFKEIPHKDLPQKVWSECINCPKFPDCDEVAVIKKLT